MYDIKVNGTIHFVVSIERSQTEGISSYITTFMSADIVHDIG